MHRHRYVVLQRIVGAFCCLYLSHDALLTPSGPMCFRTRCTVFICRLVHLSSQLSSCKLVAAHLQNMTLHQVCLFCRLHRSR